jgi:hypothetical protein
MSRARRHLTVALGTVALAAFAGAETGSAQGTPGGSITVRAEVGGKKLAATGAGRCARELGASLYDKPAALYLVEYAGSGELERIHLTLWQFKDASPSQLGLTLDAGGTSHRISTLQGGKREGEGSATVESAGAGGRIVIQGRDAKGARIQAAIECKVFGGIEAEGG